MLEMGESFKLLNFLRNVLEIKFQNNHLKDFFRCLLAVGFDDKKVFDQLVGYKRFSIQWLLVVLQVLISNTLIS